MNLRLSFVALLIVLLFSTGCSPNNQLPKGDRVKAKVLTYNIHHGNPPGKQDTIDLESVAEVINSINPDLVALQEVDVNTNRSGKRLNQAQKLAELTDMYFYFGKSMDFDGGEYGNAILSRYPMEDKMTISLPVKGNANGEPRSVAAAKIQLEGKNVIFGSTHLGLKAENRLFQVKKIKEELGSKTIPVILSGDFNATPNSSTLKSIEQIFNRICDENCLNTIPVDNPQKAIDFIYFKPQDLVEVISYDVIQEVYVSDHLPVVGELVLN